MSLQSWVSVPAQPLVGVGDVPRFVLYVDVFWFCAIPGQFIYVIRKRIKLDPEKAIFIFVNDTIPQTCKSRCFAFRS